MADRRSRGSEKYALGGGLEKLRIREDGDGEEEERNTYTAESGQPLSSRRLEGASLLVGRRRWMN